MFYEAATTLLFWSHIGILFAGNSLKTPEKQSQQSPQWPRNQTYDVTVSFFGRCMDEEIPSTHNNK